MNQKINHLTNLKSVGFKMSYDCNLDCIMCGQNKFYKSNIEKTAPKHLPLSVLKDITTQCAKYNPKMYLWGGEPFIHPDIVPFLHFLKEQKLNTFITTNGVLLNRYIDAVIESNVVSMTISFDSFEKDHEQIRGRKGIFNKIVNNLKLLAEEKKKRKSVFPIVDIHIVVVKENYRHLYDFVSFLNEHKIGRRVRIQLPMFFNESMCKTFDGYVKDTFLPFPCDKSSWSYYIDDYSEIDVPHLENEIKRIKEDFKNIIFFPDNIDIDQWFNNPSNNFSKQCHSGDNSINIEANGDLVLCANFPETIYGNIYKDSIEDLYNNAIIGKHRTEIKESLKGICNRCSYLYLFS